MPELGDYFCWSNCGCQGLEVSGYCRFAKDCPNCRQWRNQTTTMHAYPRKREYDWDRFFMTLSWIILFFAASYLMAQIIAYAQQCGA